VNRKLSTSTRCTPTSKQADLHLDLCFVNNKRAAKFYIRKERIFPNSEIGEIRNKKLSFTPLVLL